MIIYEHLGPYPRYIFFSVVFCVGLFPFVFGAVMIEAHRRKRARESRRRRKLSTSGNYAPNLECALLSRLPFELRLKIYTYVLGGNVWHIYQVPRRRTHKRRHMPSVEHEDWRLGCCLTIQRPSTNYFGPLLSLDIALLQTCRQIYLEAIPVLYTTNIFDINDLQTLIDLSMRVPAQHFATISTLRVAWSARDHDTSHPGIKDWERFCHVVATKMAGLRHFKVVLIPKGQLRIPDEPNQDWIKPLLAIQCLRTFDLLTYVPTKTPIHPFPIHIESGGPVVIPRLQYCLRQLCCTEPAAPPARSETSGPRHRTQQPTKPPNLADFHRMFEMTQEGRVSSQIEAGSCDATAGYQ
ncbi:hypothetical protein MMC07_009919 [Pseudocyphellaria aurata]|nr:hypothetical protein [Pseudocyphellaria aurata]